MKIVKQWYNRLLLTGGVYLLSITSITAQNAISSSGGTVENDTYKLSQTLGEGAIKTISDEEASLTQGVNQTKLLVTSISNDRDIKLMVFPNPTSKFLNLVMDVSPSNSASYQIYNSSGVLISKKKIEESKTTIIFEGVAVGEYLIKVTDDKKEIASYKIIKK